MKNGNKFVIEESDLFNYNNNNTPGFIIKGQYINFDGQFIKIYKKQTIIENRINCSSLKEFLEFLNLEMQKAHFNDKFNEMINETKD